MRTFVAPALLAYAVADDHCLMQDKQKVSTKLSVDAETSRREQTSKLLETAVNMIKNGVTPDVITFVDETNRDINEVVLVSIQDAHDRDQDYINGLCQDFSNAVEALNTQAAAIAVHGTNRVGATEAHHSCRADEAMACAKSRRCEEQLRQKWAQVKHEESVIRGIHGDIHEEWCIHPPSFTDIDEPGWSDWLNHPFNWAQTSPYPNLDLPQDVRDLRHLSVTFFHDYTEQKNVVERVWLEYNEKLEECSFLEEQWERVIPVCDEHQNTAHAHACEHASTNRQARETFGQEWGRIVAMFETARAAKTASEEDRKNEWETMKIVQCLLEHVHDAVVSSIETGAPCPTVDSDPDGVAHAIEDCHIVTRGCDEDSMTGHLCLNWCEPPPVPPLPPVEEPACTPAYIAKEQAQFLLTIQGTYTTELAANSDYTDDLLTAYHTELSTAGWAGCAPPLVCHDCTGAQPQAPCLEHTSGAHICHVHEEYLSPGQSNADTFRCLDGQCILQAGRCNGASNCADNSDEEGCDADTAHFVPAYLSTSFTCPADFHDDVHFRCADSQCIEKVGMCNGEENCADGSDEANCHGSIEVTVEATSGRTITVETLSSSTGVFHDRAYHFENLGGFAGKKFIKYSNDDKMTDYAHVMTKLRTREPLTVFIVQLGHHSMPWLSNGWTSSGLTGVSYSGVRETRHKEWDSTLLTEDHFEASAVYSKTFPAGTISIPGNNGGDGSFLIFLDRPSNDAPADRHGAAEFIGCFVDDPQRDLGDMVGTTNDASTNTFQLCRARCGDAQYMSLQFGGECFCSDSYGNGPQYQQVDVSECSATNEPCASNSHNCGGTWHQAIYRINPPPADPPPADEAPLECRPCTEGMPGCTHHALGAQLEASGWCINNCPMNVGGCGPSPGISGSHCVCAAAVAAPLPTCRPCTAEMSGCTHHALGAQLEASGWCSNNCPANVGGCGPAPGISGSHCVCD